MMLRLRIRSANRRHGATFRGGARAGPTFAGRTVRHALLPSLLLVASGALAQAPQKGRIEVLWGWNRDAYSASDIRFTGEGYDFTLHGVRASDRPSDISIEYLSPTKLTLPQTNLRINYSIEEHWAVGIAFDHMKYVMAQGQQVGVSGTLPEIAAQRAQGGSITLDREFLTYEHTDGLNFVNARIERRDRLARLNAIRLDIASAAGLSVGALVPRTACRFPGKELSDDYHLSGGGLGLHAGARLTFLGCIVIVAEAHGGRIWMPDVRTTHEARDRASQSFWFFEGAVLVGASIRLHGPPNGP